MGVAIAMSNANYLYILKGTNGINYIMPNLLPAVDDLSQFMRMTIYSNVTYYRQNHFSLKGWSKITPLGLHLRNLDGYSQLYSKSYQYSPMLDFFFEWYRRHPISDNALALEHDDPKSVQLFDDFVMTLRLEAVKSKLKAKVNDWESTRSHNRDRVINFEKLLFKRHGRLMVVRLDFNYHSAVFNKDEIEKIIRNNSVMKQRDIDDYFAGTDLQKKDVINGKIALEEVQRDRTRFFANMKGKPSLFEYLVGYLWRIECSREGGYHLHLVLFFDGSEVQKHEYYAQQIGKYWRDVITKGRGYFYNCNLNRRRYGKKWALGEVNHDDKIKRENLLRAMLYLTKSEQAVNVIPYKGCHFFRCGFTKRHRGCGGRPRKKAS